jgi:hypothetical protein
MIELQLEDLVELSIRALEYYGEHAKMPKRDRLLCGRLLGVMGMLLTASPGPAADDIATEGPETAEIEAEAVPDDETEKYWASRGFQHGDVVVVLETGEVGTIDALYNNAVDVHLSSGGSVLCKEGAFEVPGFVQGID